MAVLFTNRIKNGAIFYPVGKNGQEYARPSQGKPVSRNMRPFSTKEKFLVVK